MFKVEENSFRSGFYFYMNLLAPRGRGGGGGVGIKIKKNTIIKNASKSREMKR